MGTFVKNKTGGFADVIRCDEKEYLVWKWHPNKGEAGVVTRETAIRTGSVLRVKTGEVAVFVYTKENGEMEDYIVGPHDQTIQTKNFPVLASIIGLWYEGDTPFQAEVFFINLSQSIQIKFSVPYFNVLDPRFTDFEVPVAVRGTITFKIDDYKSFVKNHQLANFDMEQLKTKIIDSVTRYTKQIITNAPAEHNIPLISIESKIDLINDEIEAGIRERLKELFTIDVVSLDLSAIEVDKTSDSYLELKRLTKEVTARKVEAHTHDYEEQIRIKREEAQYAQRMATRSSNLGAYEQEVKHDVGVAAAEALGKSGGGTSGNLAQGDNGKHPDFNPITIMAGMAVGAALGQNIAGTMNNAMNPNQGNNVPPPMPKTNYYLAINNKPTGPYELNQIKGMIESGQIKNDSVLWKSGTPTWEKAESFDEFKTLFPPKIGK